MRFVLLLRTAVICFSVSLCVGTSGALAGETSRAFIGLDLGVAHPTNDNYAAHVHTGGGASPYIGYMFNNYLGIQGQIHSTAHPADSDGHAVGTSIDSNGNVTGNQPIPNEKQVTTLLGGTIGPRISIPLNERFELYATGQGGIFTGLSGRLNNTDGGFSVGGGMDVYLTHNLALSLFGRWNKAYISPKPHLLGNRIGGSGARQDPEDQGPKDARWVFAGAGLKYDFRAPVAVPPPPLHHPLLHHQHQ